MINSNTLTKLYTLNSIKLNGTNTRIWIRHQSLTRTSRSKARTSTSDGCSNWVEPEDSIHYSAGDNSNGRARNWFANRSSIWFGLTSCALTRLIALLMRYVRLDRKTIALSLLCTYKHSEDPWSSYIDRNNDVWVVHIIVRMVLTIFSINSM